MKFIDVVRKRRSSRKFSNKPVPREIVDELIEAARLAPSGGNGQNWCFGIIRDEVLKSELAIAAGEQEWIATAPIVIACCAKLDGDLKYVPEDDFGLEVNIARFGKDFISYMNAYPDRKTINTFWNNSVPLIPGEHMFLCAVSHGLSACWIGDLDIRRAGEILRLPEDMVCLFLLPIGYACDEPKEIERKAIEEIVFYERWNSDIKEME